VKYKHSIKDWPEDERPRERLLKYGADILSNTQILAIILRTGSEDGTAIDLARDLLQRFGTLRALESAGLSELCSVKGLGPAKAAQIKAAFSLSKRLRGEPVNPKDPFKTSEDVYRYYSARMDGLKKEVFRCALLDGKNRPFKDLTISEGTITSSLVHPREVFSPAIKESAVSVLFVHNHPSGDPSPSNDDIELTKRLVKTGELIGIGVLDHIIIGDNGSYISFLDKGLL
jgi:DNA repair protein RadC